MKKFLSTILVMTILISMIGVVSVSAATLLDEQFTAYELDKEYSGGDTPFKAVNASSSLKWKVIDAADAPTGGEDKVMEAKMPASPTYVQTIIPTSAVSNEHLVFEMRYYLPSENSGEVEIGFYGNNRFFQLFQDGTIKDQNDKELYSGLAMDKWQRIKIVDIANSDGVYDSSDLYIWDDTASKYILIEQGVKLGYNTNKTSQDIRFYVRGGATIYVDWMKIHTAYYAPTNLTWDGKTLTWEAAGNGITGYEVTLYKDGTKVGDYTATTKSYDFTDVMAENGAGSYTAKVVTLAGNKDTSPFSIESAAYVHSGYPFTDDFTAYGTSGTSESGPFSETVGNASFDSETVWSVIDSDDVNYPSGATGNVMKITAEKIDAPYRQINYTLPTAISGKNASFETRVYWDGENIFRIGFANSNSYVEFAADGSAKTNVNSAKVFGKGTLTQGWNQLKFVAVPGKSLKEGSTATNQYHTYRVYKYDETNGEYVLGASNLVTNYTSDDQDKISHISIRLAGSIYLDWIKVDEYTTDYPLSLETTTSKEGDTVTVSGELTRINKNDPTAVAYVLAAYDTIDGVKKLVDVALVKPAAASLAVDESTTFDMSVDISGATVPSIKLFKLESMLNLVPVGESEDITIPQQ